MFAESGSSAVAAKETLAIAAISTRQDGFDSTGVLRQWGLRNFAAALRATKDAKPTNPARPQKENRSRYSFGVAP
ncbi:hypothetical protein [Dyella sp.]|uniref:hypothetical protein n=1 Tax=Dyella sp. TaxID=1869338 RepID=UPI002D77AECC|nr:hypothetical protein [Dyella sp.]HET6432669.1 hypothetical protein [Dyella sp.]